MKLLRFGLLLTCLWVVVASGYTQDDETDTLRIIASWTGAEAEGFQSVLDLFTEQTGIEVVYEADPALVDNVTRSGFMTNRADIAFLSRPGVIRQLVANGDILPLDDSDDPILDLALMTATLNPEFVRLGVFSGRQYGLMVTSRSKSTIWYKPDSFAEFDITIPQTWDELNAIVETYIAAGRTPFALGGGTGWTLTDWFENIYVRMQGEDAYNQLFVTRQIKWDDFSVNQALIRMSNMLLPANERLTSGTDSILNIEYRESIEQWLNGDAEMYYEGGFVSTYAQEAFPDLVCGEDYSFFMFPELDPEIGTPIVGSGELAVVFNDNDAVRQFMNFIASAEAATTWVTADVGSIISPNRQVPIQSYNDPCEAMEAEQIRETTLFVFDGSDLLPGILGEYALFVALQDYLIDPGSISQILEYLVFSVTKSY